MYYVEITDPDSDELIQFHDVLVEAFPDPYGQEDVNILRENLRKGSWVSEDEVCQYHLIVARRDDRVVGGTSFYFFGDKNNAVSNGLGMGAYLAVRDDFRGNGIGTNLIAMRNQTLSRDAGKFGSGLRGLVIQVSDPCLMSAEEIEQDSMNPRDRERFWQQRGYRKIDFNFIQPPIRNGEPPIEYLSLHMFPYCSQWRSMKHISRADLQDIVYCFVKCTGTPGPFESDTSCIRMKSELAAHEYFRIV